MAKKLTRRQREVLSFIVSQILTRGYPPTLVELGNHLGISSTNGVRDHILVLERKGFLIRKASRARGILPIWDKVESVGLPRPVEVVRGSDEPSSRKAKRATSSGRPTRDVYRVPILGTAS